MKFENIVKLFETIKEECLIDSHVDFQFRNKEYSEDLGKLALEIPFQHNKYLVQTVLSLTENKVSSFFFFSVSKKLPLWGFIGLLSNLTKVKKNIKYAGFIRDKTMEDKFCISPMGINNITYV